MELNVKKLQAELGKNANQKIANHSQRFFKTGKGEYAEGDLFLGIRVPVLRSIAKKYSGLSVDDAILALHSSYHEERLVALFILIEHFKKGDQKTQKMVYNAYLKNTDYINNWDLVDSSAHLIVGAWLFDKNRSRLHRLVLSRKLFERRIGIMATYYFIKKNDYNDTLKMARVLLQDEHDLIHKAVGWMLREIGNRDYACEEKFLKQYYKQMPRTMLRYSIEKFPEDLRQKFLKGLI